MKPGQVWDWPGFNVRIWLPCAHTEAKAAKLLGWPGQLGAVTGPGPVPEFVAVTETVAWPPDCKRMLAGLALHTMLGFFAMVVVVGGGAVVVVGAGFVVVVVGGAVVVSSTMLVVVGSAVDVVVSGIEDDETPSTPPVGRVEVLGSS